MKVALLAACIVGFGTSCASAPPSGSDARVVLPSVSPAGPSRAPSSGAAPTVAEGDAQRGVGSFADAEAFYAQAVAIRTSALGPDHPLVSAALKRQAMALRQLGRNADADMAQARAKAIDAGAR